MKVCSVEGCDNKVKARSLCNMHYRRWRRYGDTSINKHPQKRSPLPIKLCSISGCEKKHFSKGFCDSHYYHFRHHGDPIVNKPIKQRTVSFCSIEGCDKRSKTHGLCSTHYARTIRKHRPRVLINNVPHVVSKKGGLKRANGEGYINQRGYVMKCNKNKHNIAEHIAIVEKVLGRKLPKGAMVHHVNHDPSDNRHENLVVCPDNAYHMLLHTRERALDECGNANWRKCHYCKQYDDLKNLVPRKDISKGYFHRNCKGGKKPRKTLETTSKNPIDDS